MKHLFTILLVITAMFMWSCEDPNEAPEVTDIVASDDAPLVGGVVTFSSSATDADDDDLTVLWTATAGTFASATLDEVEWTAPMDPVAVTITVTYSDGTDETSKSYDITVGSLPDLAYTGSEACGDCHTTIYADFVDSGHPYKFNVITDGTAPTYPSFVDNNLELPDFVGGWNEVAGVIGGFGWKARFVGTDGHVMGTAGSMYPATGSNQYNFWGGDDWGWVDYHANATDIKKYNYSCFKCHTTGAVETTNPDSSWLKLKLGIDAAETMDWFEFGGVECEACHGKGTQHAVDGVKEYIDRVTTSRLEGTNDVTDLCGDCHTRNADRSIAVSGGKVKHHEQFDEFITTGHYNNGSMSCISCHDPHKRTIWDGDSVTATCSSCHTSTTVNHVITDCKSCHMPYSGKSAVSRGAYTGDIKSHLWEINTDTTYQFLSDDGSTVRNVDGKAMLSLQFACYGCHEVAGDDTGLLGGHQTSPGVESAYSAKTLAELAAKAATIHN